MLRVRKGEEVVVSDGPGRWARTLWRGDGVEPIAGATGPGGDGSVQVEPALQPALTVVFAPTKGERPEWVVQKLTELGIDRIVPLRSERSVVRWSGQRGQATAERLRRVAREAAAQCRRVWLPEVADTIAFKDLGALGAPGEVALAQLSGDRPTVAERVIAVGPEGGWSSDELGSGLPTVGFGLECAPGRDGRRTRQERARWPPCRRVSWPQWEERRSDPRTGRHMSDSDCIFCKIVAGDLPSDIVYAAHNTIAFKDINPAAELHVLVIPRRHIEDASVVTAEDGPVLAEMLMAAGRGRPGRPGHTRTGLSAHFQHRARRHELGAPPSSPRARRSAGRPRERPMTDRMTSALRAECYVPGNHLMAGLLAPATSTCAR